jgi:integrase
MARPKTLEPKYRHHKSSGQAYVVLDGKDVWLGEHGSKASRNKYHTVLSEWIARDRQGAPSPVTPDGGPTVSMVLAAFLKHAATYYASPDGTPSAELNHFRRAMRLLKRLYGATPAAEFGPLKLKAARVQMLQPRTETDPITGRTTERPGWARTYANHQVNRVRAIFKWAVENEMIPASVHHGLLAVGGLRKGRTEARETEPVTPAPDDQVEAVRRLVSPQVRAMIDLQLLTGARPGEVCQMRWCDVQTGQDVWEYRPAAHKTAHHGHARVILIGPKAKLVLAPFVRPDVHGHVFSPTDAERARAERLREDRRTPVQPSQRKRAERSRRRRRRRAPTDRYDVASYRRAIARACARAFPPPPHLARQKGETAAAWQARLTAAQRAELKRWAAEHRWHPHQLRHNAATRLRRKYGLEAAQVILGHKTLAVTEIYAEKNVAAARKIMGEVG